MKTREITDRERKLLEPCTKERTVFFWGSEYQITPVLLGTVFGDGGQLMWLETTNNRPEYYVVLVGSEIELEESHGERGVYELFDSFPEDIYMAIEEEFGNCDDVQNAWGDDSVCEKFQNGEECSYCEELFECEFTAWPALNCGSGCAWGAIKTKTNLLLTEVKK